MLVPTPVSSPSPPNFKVTQDNTQDVHDAIAMLSDLRLLVGVPAEKGERQPDPETGKMPDITNAELAYIHDNGAPEANIPAREFLRPAVSGMQDDINKALRAAGRAAFDGNEDRVLAIYNALGLKTQSAIRQKIIDGPFTPLAEATLAARRAKGFKGTKPLNVTGQLRNAQTYVIRSEKLDGETGEFGEDLSGDSETDE